MTEKEQVQEKEKEIEIEIIKKEETEEGTKLEFYIHNEERTFTDLLAETLRDKKNVINVASTVEHPILNKEHPKLFIEVKEGDPIEEVKKGLKELGERNQEWLQEIEKSLK